MSDTDWFRRAKWGLFMHFLGDVARLGGADRQTEVDLWNVQVDGFDVQALADQLEEVGAGYFFITIGQNSGHYCSPNATYDRLTGIAPSKCSRRDLVADIADALGPRGIRMMVYLPSGAAAQDDVAAQRLAWEWGFEGKWPSWSDLWPNPNDPKRTGKRLVEFQLNWESVIREWSQRWGSKVSGWWIDGCYFPDEMYRHAEAPNFGSFTEALKSGNPGSIVAFNPGVFTPVITMTEHEDFTAGEIAEAFPVCPGAKLGSAQYHILSYLGETWGQGKPRFAEEFVIGYTKDLVQKGGVMTWDVPFNSNGTIAEAAFKQLANLKNTL